MGGEQGRAAQTGPATWEGRGGANELPGVEPVSGWRLPVDQALLIDEFLAGCLDRLEKVDQDLLALDQDRCDPRRLTELLRFLHNIKGTCGFFRFSRLETLAHAGENVVARWCAGEIASTPALTCTLFELVEAIRSLLIRIERDREEGEIDHSAIFAALSELERGAGRTGEPWLGQNLEAGEARLFGQLLVRRGLASREAIASALDQQARGDPRHLGEILVEAGVLQPRDVQAILQAQEELGAPTPGERSIRVEPAQLDRLARQIDALARVQRRMRELAEDEPPAGPLREQFGQLARITAGLQAQMLQLRVQPIGTLWRRLAPLVGDLAATLGKRVRLEMEGEETSLDRATLAALRDPFTHLLRNALDHGIELPAARELQGKPPEGRLLLRASIQDDETTLTVADDGAGVDQEKIRRTAIEHGWLADNGAAPLDQQALLSFIFRPGFSTAKQVTHLSGRGVGLDVVKRSLEALGGQIGVESERGQGTLFRIRVPRSPDHPSDELDLPSEVIALGID